MVCRVLASQQEEVQGSDYGNVSLAFDDDKAKFVRFMHLASPYVMGHRGKTFVIVIPGEVGHLWAV